MHLYFVPLDFHAQVRDPLLEFRLLALPRFTLDRQRIRIALELFLAQHGRLGLAHVAGDFRLCGNDDALRIVHRLPGIAQAALHARLLIARRLRDARVIFNLLPLPRDVLTDGIQRTVGGLQLLLLVREAVVVRLHVALVLLNELLQFPLALTVESNAALRGVNVILPIVELVPQTG